MCLPAIAAGIGSVIGGIGSAIGGLTAAGAGGLAATGLTVGGALQAAGAVAGVAGAIYQNKQTKKYAAQQTAAVQEQNVENQKQIERQSADQTEAVTANRNEQTANLDQQSDTERALAATEDYQRRREFSRAIAQQRADLAARGVALDSPTAILLGQQAAIEMSYESQAVRSTSNSRLMEIEAAKRATRLDADVQLTNIRNGKDANLTDIRLNQNRTLADIQARAKSDRLTSTVGAVTSVLNSAPKIWPGLADYRLGQKVLT